MDDSTPEFIHHELPVLEDPTLLAAGASLGAIRSAVIQSLPQLVRDGRGEVSGQALSAVVGILNRITEVCLSVELLVSKGRWRDAATLLLTIFELRLDLQYLVAEQTRVETWLSHREKGRKPWRVTEQIRDLFPDDSEREAERSNYRSFSMIKHGNPAADGLGFSIHPGTRHLTVHGDEMNLGMSVACLFTAGTNLMEAVVAARELLETVGIDFSNTLKEVKAEYSTLEEVQHDHIVVQLRELQQQRREADDSR